MKNSKGIIFIVSAPSGTGKSTLVKELLQKNPEKFARVVTCTTRSPREEEKEGIDYYFLEKKEFEKRVQNNEFLEVEPMYGYEYGTLKKEVHQKIDSGKHVVLVIGVGGALQLMKKIEAVYIFIAPPSMSELERRICKRGANSEEEQKKRMARAEKELQKKDFYDYLIVNDIFEDALQALQSIVVAEEHKVLRIKNEKTEAERISDK